MIGATSDEHLSVGSSSYKDPFTKGNFACVYACDRLSSTEVNEYPKTCLVNTYPMELSGTNWIAIYFNEKMKG